MPCNSCSNHSEPRGMDPVEQWKSFSRHHTVLEVETEKLREICKRQAETLKMVQKMFPGMHLGDPLTVPPQTPEWKNTTYRDANGKWPSDIRKHLDWLSEDDFKR